LNERDERLRQFSVMAMLRDVSNNQGDSAKLAKTETGAVLEVPL
jgi:hypothetical protein